MKKSLALALLLFAVNPEFASAAGTCSAFFRLEAPALIKPEVFKEYDIRGDAIKDLSPEFARKLGLAFNDFLRAQKPTPENKRLKVSVAHDARVTSPAFRDALIEGLLAGGIDVIDIDMTPTPMSYYSAKTRQLDGAIMITASHNPGKYNGFKISVGEEPIFGKKIKELGSFMEQPTHKRASSPGRLTSAQLIPEFHDYVRANFRMNGLKVDPNVINKVVIDSTNGVAGRSAPELYRSFGIDVVSMFENPDGTFPNHNPDPSVAANLVALQEKVKQTGAKLGIAFDGDADRIVVVDEGGDAVPGDVLMALLAKDVLKRHPGATIMGEVKMGQVFYDTITQYGGNPVMYRTGAALMKERFDELDVALAGESSGHIIYGKKAGWIKTDDAIYVGARLMAIMSEDGRPLSRILAPFLGRSKSTPEERLGIDENKKFALVDEVKKRLAASGYDVTTIDGVRVTLPNGSWGLLRASNTEPVLSTRFEARTDKELEDVQRLIADVIASSAKAIGYDKPIRPASGH